MKKKDFLESFNEAIGDESIKYIEVEVEDKKDSEFISFGRNMFKSEYDYYNNSYDDNMNSKQYKDVKAVNIRVLDNLNDL